MDSKFAYVESLIQEISHIDAELEDLEMDLREHPEINNYSPEPWNDSKISERICSAREGIDAIDKVARRLLEVYSGAKIGTYRKVGTVKAERFWPVDNDKIDYYRAKYGITQLGGLSDSEISGFKPTMGAQVVYEGPNSYAIPTLEGEIIINNGDWILTGVDGEHWAVKDEIFNKTYKKVTNKNDD